MKISVIIPVKNGAATLEQCLKSIKEQTVTDIEIIVLDSMSTDGSREIAYMFGAKIISISDGTFNHGLTRNVGVQNASGNFLFFTVQDAWIAENFMLEKMAQHFSNSEIMAVAGHQALPHEADKNPLMWFKPYSEPQIVIKKLHNLNEMEGINQQQQAHLIAWDNVVAMYRKEALLHLPFVETEMSEDWVWCRDALLEGWTMIYDPSILVYHYHHENYNYSYRVTYSVNYHFFKFFGFIPQMPPLLSQLARATWHISKNKNLKLSKKFYWLLYNYKSQLGKFNANLNFRKHLKRGGANAVKKRFLKVCKTIPQGKQNTIN